MDNKIFMNRTFLLITLSILGICTVYGQKIIAKDSMYFISLNQQIDSCVVEQNMAALDTLYAEDFIFSHGTGLIEGKTRWLSTVRKTKYPERKHDSVTVEVHPDMAIVRGKLYIQRFDKGQIVKYTLKYVRIYALRKKIWQLVSHITTEEQDER